MNIATTCKTLAVAAAIALTASGALGQVTASLPGSIVRSGTMSPAASQQIHDYVESLTAKVQSDDLRDATRAREQLLAPLSDRDVSVAFRQAYAQSLKQLMSDLDGSGEIAEQLLALRLAGELGTTQSISLIRARMSDDDRGLRLFAIGRTQRVFEITAAHGAAISASEASALVAAVTEQAQSESDMMMVEGAVRALVAGSSLPGADLSNARNQSIQSLEAIISPILRGLGSNDSTEQAYRLALRASSAITVSITDLSATITAESTTAAVGLAGDMLSVPLRQIFKGRELSDTQRSLSARAVQSGEALLYFARRKHSAGQVAQTGFASMIRSKDNRDYRDGVSKLLGANSQIVRDFGFASDRFVFEN